VWTRGVDRSSSLTAAGLPAERLHLETFKW
jgi:hypothetical protein